MSRRESGSQVNKREANNRRDNSLMSRLKKGMKALRTESGAQVTPREIDRIINKALRMETGAAVSQGEKKRAERLLREMD